MRHRLPFRFVILTLLVLASMIVPPRPALASSLQPAAVLNGNLWVDAQAGNDANNGLSASSAFRTIQAAAKIAGPGTTVHILPGIYRESVTPAYDGTASARITYKAESGPGTVKVRGSQPASSVSWSRLASNTIGLPSSVSPSNVYYADLSSWGLSKAPRFVVQLSAQGDVNSRLPLAREPDWTVPTQWRYAEFWWAADGGSSAATCNPATNTDHNCDSASRSSTQLTDRTNDAEPAGIESGNLTTLGNLTGGTVVAMDTVSGHYVYRRTIASHDVAAGRITVAQRCDFDAGSGTPGLGWGSKYYVENRPALLDTPGEWWYDTATSRLYLWPPQAGSPATENIEISRLPDGLRLNGRSYTTIDGLTLELFNNRAVTEHNNSSKSYANIVRNTTLRYVNTGLELGQEVDSTATNITDGFTLENSVIAHADTQAIDMEYYWPGGTADTFTHAGIQNTVIRNNEMYDLAFRSDVDNTDGFLFAYANKLRFEGNHVHDVAHNGIAFAWSVIQSTKDRGFSPSEIKTGEILLKDNLFEKTCELAADCGAVKLIGRAPNNHVFRDFLLMGNVFRNVFGWTYISQQRDRWAGGTGSAVQGMGAFGLYLDHASGIQAYRNIAYNNSWANFNLYTAWGDAPVLLYNNILANSLVGISLGGDTQTSTNTQVANNIVINNENYGVQIRRPASGVTNFVVDNNLYYNNGWRSSSNGGLRSPGDMVVLGPDTYLQTLAAIQLGTAWEDHGVEGDPHFVSYDVTDHSLFDGSWPDFHLTASSLNAINRGSASLPSLLSALLTKFGVADAPVGSAFDIGRYESGSSATPPPTTTTPPAPPATPTATPTATATPPPSIKSNIDVNVGAQLMPGPYLLRGQAAPASYDALDAGPVKVNSLKLAFPILASARFVYAEGTGPDHRSGTPTSYAEVMGYPLNRLTYDYRFPWYDNVNMSSELLLANFGTANITVNVYVGSSTTPLGSYPLTPSQSISVSLDGLDAGPLRVAATSTGARFLAAQRIIYPDSGGNATSYAVLMGMPRNQVIANYWIPWYDNVNMSSELRLSNMTLAKTVTVKVYLGATLLGTYPLEAGTTTQVSYPDLNAGPLHLTSVGGLPFIASERVIYPDGSGNPTSYSELMALPNGQVVPTYWLPSNGTPGSNTAAQLRISNPNTGTTTAQVWLNGVLLNSYPIKARETIVVQDLGQDPGPLKVKTADGKRIIVSMPVIQSLAGDPTSYSEMAGYPAGRLTRSYVFPWYNNVNFDTELSIAAP